MSAILEKHPEESRIYDIDFSKFPEIIEGDTIASIVSVTKTSITGDDTLVIEDETASADRAQFRLSAGESGDSYVIEAVVLTTAGMTLAGCGKLKVKACV